MGAQITMMSDYFDRCRRKRNNIQYDQVNVATKSEVDELIAKAEQFRKTVIEWLKRNYPKLLPVGDSGGGS